MKGRALTPDELRAQISLVLETAAPGSCLEPHDVDELFEKFNIYHQELEYQNEELKRIANDLEVTRTHLKDLYENAPVAYLTFDDQLTIQSANKAFRELLGPGLSAPFQTPWNRYLTPNSQDAFYFHQRALLQTGVAEPCVVSIESQGRVQHLKLESNRQAGGQPVEYRSTLTNLTRELEIEAQLRLSESRFKEVVEKATDGIIILSEDSRILVWNHQMQEITGQLQSRSVGRLLWEVQSEMALPHEAGPGQAERLREFLDIYLRALKQGTQPRTTERQIRRRDGQIRSVEATIFLLQTGLETRYGAIFRDVTVAKRLQEELAQAKKTEAIGLLAGGIAHDFNNLLGVIFGRLELAKQRPDLTESLEKDLEQIEKAARRSADMTRQLLTYARKQAALTEELDMNTSITSLVPLLRRLVDEGVELSLQLAPDLPQVLLDPSQLDQILTNLTSNARDALGGQGSIRIGTAWEPAGDLVVLTFEDTGSGMDEATQSRLFEPFFTTKKLGHGTGLGLATVHGVVYQNHGEISVTSQLGKGTFFRITLPAFHGHALSKKRVETVTGEQPTRKRTIFVVEDEAEILEFVTLSLQAWGHHVTAGGTAEEALRLLQNHEKPVDILVTDIMLPGMNGKELAARFKAKFPALKTIFMSGYSGDVLAEAGVLPQDLHFLQKPFDLAQLKAQIDDLSSSIR